MPWNVTHSISLLDKVATTVGREALKQTTGVKKVIQRISAHNRCFQMKNPLIISLYFSINPAQPMQCKSTPVRASGPYWHIEIAAWIIRNKEETQINTSALVGPYPCLLLVLSCSCCSCTSAYFSHFKHMLLCPMVEVISSLESHQFPWWT